MKDSQKRDYFRLHAQVCSSIANAKRLEILSILRKGELNVSALAESMQVAPANVSQQLAILRNSGILERRMQGTTAYYRISNRKIVQALDIMSEVLQAIIERRRQSLSAKNPDQGR